MERKDYLVYLKEGNGGFSTKDGTEFKPNVSYRSIELSEDNTKQILVFGHVFSEAMFNLLFETAHDRIMRHFELIGLVKGGKPINKTNFNALANHVKYGKGKNAFWSLYFYTHPKEYMYRFSPPFSGDNKKVVMQNFYESFIILVNGDTTEIDEGLIEFGNCGLPIGSFGRLQCRYKEMIKDNIF